VAPFTSTELNRAIQKGMVGMGDLIALNEDEARTIANVSCDEEIPSKLITGCVAALTRCNHEMRIVISFGSKSAHAVNKGGGDILLALPRNPSIPQALAMLTFQVSLFP